MSEHRHSFEQRFERSIPSCTVKVWECRCGAWNIRHFGCFNQRHDQDTLATLAAALEALQKYGKHGILCMYGLLPSGIHRQTFTPKEDMRLEAASIKECACGLLAAIATPEEARERR